MEDSLSPVEVLENYRSAMFEREAIERQIERIHLEGGPTELHGIGNGGRGTNDPTAAAVQRWDGLEERLTAQVVTLIGLAERFWQIVDGLETGKERTIIVEYYANGKSDQQIADMLEKDRRTAFRVRHAILERLMEDSKT